MEYHRSSGSMSLPLPYLDSLRPVMLLALSLSVSACMSESERNPFDVSAFSTAGSKEPFSSTVYAEPKILTQSSPSTYQQATYQGQAQRLVFDRRTAEFADKIGRAHV